MDFRMHVVSSDEHGRLNGLATADLLRAEKSRAGKEGLRDVIDPNPHNSKPVGLRSETRAVELFVSVVTRAAAEAIKCPSCVAGEALDVHKEILMFLTLFGVLLVMWLLGFFAFHVAGGLIHLLLIIAVISLVAHVFRGRSAV
jgi:hypothetical protein